jgi:uracil-DNA glycosylase
MAEWNSLDGTDWNSLLRREFEQPYWSDLQRFLERQRSSYPVYPPLDQVFRALRLTSYARTKVVIVGQDPYVGSDQAHGLAFSVPRGIQPPPTLSNILRELHCDMCVPIPGHGNLEAWAGQGVLLLNTVLTVRAGEPGSHRNQRWERFTDTVIAAVQGKADRVVFILWGKQAQRKKALLRTDPHTVICSPHPSPLSAWKGFMGSKPFSRANRALVDAEREGVDWRLAE